MNSLDLLIIGAGPVGLACGIEAQRAGLSYMIIDKENMLYSLTRWPTYMTFFSTPEKLEIGGMPFVCSGEKPTRLEGLEYYRKVAEAYELNIHPFEKVLEIKRTHPYESEDPLEESKRPSHPQGWEEKSDSGLFHIKTTKSEYTAKNVIIATGYSDFVNPLNVPGENLPKVTHYYQDAFPYIGCEVLVIGAKSSGAEVALDLARHGAKVTLVVRAPTLPDSLKYWLKPNLENRIKEGSITAHFSTVVKEIKSDSVVLQTIDSARKIPNPKIPKSQNEDEDTSLINTSLEGGRGEFSSVNTETFKIANAFVFAMTGYRPDFDFLRSCGIEISETGNPMINPETMETNIPGLFLAGAVTTGLESGKVFIENGRDHAKRILAVLK